MPIVTPIEYYEDESAHGNYQYVPLKDIINSLEMDAQDDDHVLKNTKRYQILKHVRAGLQEVHKQAANQVCGFSITVPGDLVFELPQDYLNYVRVCVIEQDASTGAKYLRELDVNHRINTVDGYLQDHDAELLFDSEGYILESDGDNAYGVPYQTIPFCRTGSQYSLDTSKLSEHGEFVIDEKRGKMLFSSGLMDREITFEYVTDGLEADLNEEQVKVHKHLFKVIEYYATHACIEGKVHVRDNLKERYLRRYKTVLHQAKLDRADFNFTQIARTLRSQSKQKH